MQISRRFFMECALAAAGTTVLGETPQEPRKLRFGVVSDIHFRNPGDENIFLKAMKWYREQDVDAVMIAGDMADTGQVVQLQRVADTWYSVFPNDTGNNGKHVEKLFIYGNHDWHGWWHHHDPKVREEWKKTALAQDHGGFWEKIFHEKWAPVYAKNIKGYTFIGMHWGQQEAMKKLVAELAPTLPGDRPFFYFQHAHPYDTIYGKWAWGAWDDKKAASTALAPFPHAVAFTGHSHYPLIDERGIWQGAFTSIGTASLRYIGHAYGRENAGTDNGKKDFQMPRLRDGFQQGMLVDVYSDRMVIARRDFTNDEQLAADWIVPLPTKTQSSHPYAFAPRLAASIAPEFPEKATATIEERKGKSRRGVETDQVVVSFPAAVSHDEKDRIYEYEVQAQATYYDVLRPYATKRVLADRYFLAIPRIAETGHCVFAKSELPKLEPIRFQIRPMNCFGKAGKAIYTKTINLS